MCDDQSNENSILPEFLRDKSILISMSLEEKREYKKYLIHDLGWNEKKADRAFAGTAADPLNLWPQDADGRAERLGRPAIVTALLHAVAFVFIPRNLQASPDTRSDHNENEGDVEVLGACYTNVRNRNCDDSALLPTDRKRFNICDQCTFITRLQRQHKKRLVSNDRVYCTFTETDEQWDTFCDKLREEHQASDKQIMVAYGKSAATVLEQMFTAKAISTKRNHNIVMESQYTPAIYDVRVGVTPEVRVTQEALVSPAETTTINFP
eukprot:m.280929 g.280929  ORF g.280929 m.280929 type:complete len:266 (+) comp19833_c0_seq1:348-1145(+)